MYLICFVKAIIYMHLAKSWTHLASRSMASLLSLALCWDPPCSHAPGPQSVPGVILQGLILVETDLNICWHLIHASWLLRLRQWFQPGTILPPQRTFGNTWRLFGCCKWGWGRGCYWYPVGEIKDTAKHVQHTGYNREVPSPKVNIVKTETLQIFTVFLHTSDLVANLKASQPLVRAAPWL